MKVLAVLLKTTCLPSYLATFQMINYNNDQNLFKMSILARDCRNSLGDIILSLAKMMFYKALFLFKLHISVKLKPPTIKQINLLSSNLPLSPPESIETTIYSITFLSFLFLFILRNYTKFGMMVSKLDGMYIRWL